MLTAEVFNWTGHVLRSPRTQLKEALSRSEVKHTGVYILLGEKGGRPLAYIGEAEEISTRLINHAANKDWWETVIAVTTAADNLHKAHVKYLESRLVEIAKSVSATSLENANIPARSSLSEADIANMESFLETLQMVLPAIRVDLFLDKSRATTAEDNKAIAETVVFEIASPRIGVNAVAHLKDGEMIVQAGSLARSSWVGDTKSKTHYHKLFEELCEIGILVASGDHSRFTKDYAFSSPSAAGAIVNGRSTNGRTAWKLVNDGRTYAEWEAAQLERSIGE